MVEPDDTALKTTAGYDPMNGMGKTQEIDHGHHSGPQLMFAMMNPEKFGKDGGTRLNIFDSCKYWHKDGMI